VGSRLHGSRVSRVGYVEQHRPTESPSARTGPKQGQSVRRFRTVGHRSSARQHPGRLQHRRLGSARGRALRVEQGFSQEPRRRAM